MARKRATLTELLNNFTARVLYDKFRVLACSAFEWEGLPEGIEPRHIERHLFDHGKAVFIKDPHMSYMALECHDGGQYNVYGDPLKYVAVGTGYTKHYDADKCVVIENNLFRIPTKDPVVFYVNKIAEAERTMDVNTKAVKTPFIFTCTDKDLMTFKAIFEKIDGNVPAIFTDKAFNLDSVQVLQTGVSFMGNELMDYKKSVENELLTFLGFNNLAVDKKERVNTDEANSNNQLTQSFAELQLAAREAACKRINEMYDGLNVSVKRREVAADAELAMGHDKADSGTPGNH